MFVRFGDSAVVDLARADYLLLRKIYRARDRMCRVSGDGSAQNGVQFLVHGGPCDILGVPREGQQDSLIRTRAESHYRLRLWNGRRVRTCSL